MPQENQNPLLRRSSDDPQQRGPDSEDENSNNSTARRKSSNVKKLRRMFSTGPKKTTEHKAIQRIGKVFGTDPNLSTKKSHARPNSTPTSPSPQKNISTAQTPLRINSAELGRASADPSAANSTFRSSIKKEGPADVPLHEGDCIGSETKKYLVKRKLGAGGYGAVYHVVMESNEKIKKHFALKAELRSPGTSNRLKMEVEVLRSIRKADKSLQSHFAMIADTGRVSDFAFVVITLCGPSIASIRERVLITDFSHACAIRVGLDSLDAIKDFHTIGYIHRDIKPSNLTIGLGNAYTNIYLIDFGVARRLLNEKGHIRLPRSKARFVGTSRYASRASHRYEDQARHSDLESWFYMLMDLYNQNSLPWKRIKEKDLILALKEDIRANEGRSRCIVDLMPSEFRLVMLYIDSLKYENVPDYDYIRTLLEATLKRLGLTLHEPFDWERFGPPPCDED
ncbi:hypothetical protein L596_020321 [Steinernema carpocapsae]|uniref:non-specific serine/threonine protein kinase n=1 Tax=Steinernema carpocapsae TaxID=34508 RepID=A0A4U5MT70_STECR|nr:hypothetical protein L596_020321 [Steinernema carpocapsae]